jgi:hypothetical protein
MPNEKPLIHALVLCDHVHRDKSTGKHTLIGTFNGISVKNDFPIKYGPVAIYMALSHWVHEQELGIQIVHNSINIVGKLPKIKIPKQGPNDRCEFGLNLPPLPLPEPGRYEIQILVDAEILHVFSFDVKKG